MPSGSRKKHKKIVFIGGGSYAWTPNIVKDMLLTESIRDSEFVLYDINPKAARLVASFLERINDRLKTPARFTATSNRKKALHKADYLVITLSTGGLKAMANDLAIPEKFGIYHTVGDTSGPGGWARFMRNYSVFKDLGSAFNQLAPGAMILNYTNPLTTLTDVLSRTCDGPVVGLCHGLFENLELLKKFYKAESEEDLSVRYAGLNHFFWMTEIKIRQRDILKDLKRRLRKQSITDLLKAAHKDEMGFSSKRELATELFRQTGVMPYLGDRHTCEFLPSYITSKQNMKKYRLIRTTVAERRQKYVAREKMLKRLLKQTIPDHFFKRSRETAADIIAAHAEGRPFIDVGNVPNIGQISNLPLGTVVETAVQVDATGFTPLTHGPLPAPVLGLVEPYAHVFNMAVEACLSRDKNLAMQALRLDPVCGHLNTAQVEQMGQQLLNANNRFSKSPF